MPNDIAVSKQQSDADDAGRFLRMSAMRTASAAIVAAALLFGGSDVAANPPPSTPATPVDLGSAAPPLTGLIGRVENFGERNAVRMVSKLAGGGGIRYVQLGDSHTAADFMTDAIRTRMFADAGRGGLGWATPVNVPGQRIARVTVTGTDFRLVNSRDAGSDDYPLGGMYATASTPGAAITVAAWTGSPVQTVDVLLRQAPGDRPVVIEGADGTKQQLSKSIRDGAWHTVRFRAQLPFTLRSRGARTDVGGWWLSSKNGAHVSALGINGSTLSQWSRWRAGWMEDLSAAQPDVIALSYGTNEAFSATFDGDAFRQELTHAVEGLRTRFPNAAILIVGAPETLKSKAGDCGIRPEPLDAIQTIQREVASAQRTLYWDWQRAMGGRCAMTQWIRNGLGNPDGVHFTAEGYQRLGEDLYQGLTRPVASSAH